MDDGSVPAPLAPARHVFHGKGKAVLRASGNSASFSELSYGYPLKLLSPRTVVDGPIATVYVLSYGGGLVSGDRIDLEVDVGERCSLLMLTQGFTKVFRARGKTISDPSSDGAITRQRLSTTIRSQSLLLLLPDPVTCFARSSYSQIQTFDLAPSGSAIILDWFTSGRMSRGEVWELDRYRSVNEIRIDGKRVARDVMLIENRTTGQLKRRLAPYGCYATVFLFGPLVQPVLQSLRAQYDTIQQMQLSAPEPFIWSLSPLEKGDAGILRCAGKETETVRVWLRAALADVGKLVGKDVYDKAFV
ncbi:UreD-domain-containing protein [Calocera viscosa TUFC12733]|uniref:UreD-domain-containing protein n=1 Tax=Calocera viscosa (strain TUFC12733) TaxID=1330018 RepID=A0A167K164_CALVF|nr:UreD-domain-containing protein [Calocera viscosa TUFC12733]